jgi:sec-independent protein translocase protein TatA
MASHTVAMLIGGVGLQEILLILLILVILFGGRKIPELARGLGRGVSEFKRGMHDTSSDEPPSPPSPPPGSGNQPRDKNDRS